MKIPSGRMPIHLDVIRHSTPSHLAAFICQWLIFSLILSTRLLLLFAYKVTGADSLPILPDAFPSFLLSGFLPFFFAYSLNFQNSVANFFFFSLSNLVRWLIRPLPDASGFSTIRHVSVQIAAGGAPSPIRTATITQTISFCSNYANESIISILTQLTTQLAA